MKTVSTNEYVKNPRLQIYYDRSSSGEVVGLTVLAPDRLRGRQILRMAISDSCFENLKTFLRSDCAECVEEFSAEFSDLLVATSLLIEKDSVSRPVTFSCEPTATIPDMVSSTGLSNEDSRNEIINPYLINDGGRQSDECLIKHPVNGMVIRYRLSSRFGEAYKTLLEHHGRSCCLEPDDRQLLKDAGILVSPDYLMHQEIERRQQVNDATNQYRRQGFAVIRKTLASYYLNSLQQYYRSLFEEGYASYGDSLSDGRFQIYNEQIASTIQHQLAPFVSAIIGSVVKPSYCFAFFYRQKACLPQHRDRANFAVTLSIAIQYAPYDSITDAWPLYLGALEDEAHRCEVRLEPGSAVLFDGAQLYHGRERFSGEWFTNLVMGYVHESFAGPLELY